MNLEQARWIAGQLNAACPTLDFAADEAENGDIMIYVFDANGDDVGMIADAWWYNTPAPTTPGRRARAVTGARDE